MRWKMNSKYFIKQTSQEIHYLADRILKLSDKKQNEMTVLVLFLAGLSSKFDNACQVLELQVKSFNQTVESLVTTEASMGEPDTTSFELNDEFVN